jgi:hypothetical protein
MNQSKNFYKNQIAILSEQIKFLELELEAVNEEVKGPSSILGNPIPQDLKDRWANRKRIEDEENAKFQARRQEMMAKGKEINPATGRTNDEDREAARIARAQDYYGDVLANTASKTPDQLSAKESADLLMYNIMSGKSKRDPKIYGYDKPSEQAKETADNIGFGSYSNAVTKLNDPKAGRSDEEIIKLIPQMLSNIQLPTSEIANISREASRRENPTRISGMSPITRGQFYSQTGQDYNALNPQNVSTFRQMNTGTPDYTDLSKPLPPEMSFSSVLNQIGGRKKPSTNLTLNPQTRL